MAPESMVHALETIHGILNLDGYLLDIHSTGAPAQISVHTASGWVDVGVLAEVDDYIEYKQAFSAVENVINRKLFQKEDVGSYDYFIHASTLPELQQYFSIDWKDAIIPESVLLELKRLQFDEIRILDCVYTGLLRPL